MTAILTERKLHVLRRRRSAGESVKAMAQELGVTWQKLDKAIRNGISAGRTRKTTRKGRPAPEAGKAPPVLALERSDKPGPLTERYRPRSLDALFGQERVVQFLKRFAAHPYPMALLFEGETGTGKTSAALALAAAIGCDVTQKPQEFGGVHVIASGEQSAEAVRDTCRQMWHTPFHGSGWKVVIVNEVDRMHPQAETIWLDRLECLPPRTVIVFTTNFPEKLSRRLRDRCTRLGFESGAEKLSRSARELLAAIWRHETGKAVEPSSFSHLVESATEAGQLSFRRAVQLLTPLVEEAKSKGVPRRSEAKPGGAP